MLFNSFEYLIFLPLVVGIYYVLSQRAQNLWLLAASYVFYGWWDWRFLSLVLGSTAVDYVCGRRLGRTESALARRTLLITSIVVNLGILCVFKYYDFFVQSAAHVLETIGMSPNPASLHIILPLGISFYTFQTMSYTIDVYRRRVRPETDPLTFALYVCYFPQLVAGPIERASRLLPQLNRTRRVDNEAIGSGLVLILIGLSKKIAIADMVAPEVAKCFDHAGTQPWGMLLCGMYLFSIQIYCDFSGYSDIARGTSRLLGIELMENFNQPYLSSNITEFWRRWHISLSTWLRDYLYVPLGGNRKGPRRTYINLMLTMLIGGLWHGAAWRFVAWGGLHGAYLSVHKLILKGRRPPERHPLDRPARWIAFFVKLVFTFHLVALAWVFFRAGTFADAWAYLQGIFGFRGAFDSAPFRRVAFFALLMMALDLPMYLRREHTAIMRLPVFWRGLAYACLFLLVVQSGPENAPFIYFQF